jgi:hypothetical protein
MLVVSLTPRVRILLDPFSITNYEIKEVDYADYEVNDPFAAAFVEGLQPELSAIKQCLTLNHFNNLVIDLVNLVVTRFEA